MCQWRIEKCLIEYRGSAVTKVFYGVFLTFLIHKVFINKLLLIHIRGPAARHHFHFQVL